MRRGAVLGFPSYLMDIWRTYGEKQTIAGHLYHFLTNKKFCLVQCTHFSSVMLHLVIDTQKRLPYVIIGKKNPELGSKTSCFIQSFTSCQNLVMLKLIIKQCS